MIPTEEFFRSSLRWNEPYFGPSPPYAQPPPLRPGQECAGGLFLVFVVIPVEFSEEVHRGPPGAGRSRAVTLSALRRRSLPDYPRHENTQALTSVLLD